MRLWLDFWRWVNGTTPRESASWDYPFAWWLWSRNRLWLGVPIMEPLAWAIMRPMFDTLVRPGD